MIFVVTGIFLLCGLICHFVAKQRGLSPVFWGVMGVVFGPLALPGIFFVKRH